MLFDSFYRQNFEASIEKFLGCTAYFITDDATNTPEFPGTFVGTLDEDKKQDSIINELTKGLFKVRKEVLIDAGIDYELYQKLSINNVIYTIIEIKDIETDVLEFQLGVSETKKVELRGKRRVF